MPCCIKIRRVLAKVVFRDTGQTTAGTCGNQKWKYLQNWEAHIIMEFTLVISVNKTRINSKIEIMW